MIRSKTAFIIGPGAAAELHLPGPADMLDRIAQALDFSRSTANQMTRDAAAILRYVGKLAERIGCSEDMLYQAAQRIQKSAGVSATIENVIEQNDDNPLVEAFGKLAVAVFTLQSEARSSVRPEPQPNSSLPLQTGDYWLLELGKLITAGLPRTRIEQGLQDIAIISFTYDRAVEHFLPYVLTTAYGMTLQEAQQLAAAKLKVLHPYGSVGRLPWQDGVGADVDWGNEAPENMIALVEQLKTFDETIRDRAALGELRAAVAGAQRIVFLGFDFAPQSLELLVDTSLSHNPELIVTMTGMSEPNRLAALRMLKQKTGIEHDDRVLVSTGRCLDLFKDYALLLGS